MSINLYIVRHGESEHNSYLKKKKEAKKAGVEFTDVITTIDLPLTEKGIEEAVKAAEQIKHVKIEKIYTSPFIRTKQTTDHIQTNLGIVDIIVEETDLLKEYSRGDLNLMDADELDALMGHSVQEIEHNLLYDYSQHNGESYIDVKKRAAQFLNTVIQNDHTDVLVITSAGVIKTMYQILFGNILPGIHFNIYAKNGSVHEMKLDRKFIEERIKDLL